MSKRTKRKGKQTNMAYLLEVGGGKKSIFEYESRIFVGSGSRRELPLKNVEKEVAAGLGGRARVTFSTEIKKPGNWGVRGE